MLSDEEITMESGHLSVEEVWYAHETAPHHFVSGYVEFARVIEAAVLAKLQAQSEPVPKGVLLALSNAGLTLIKTQHGYEVRNIGQITAQTAPVRQDVNQQLLEALKWALEWIDAVPKGTALPTMPGFDRDYVDTLISKAGKQ